MHLMDRVKVVMEHKEMAWDELALLTHIPANRLVDLSTGRQGSLLLWECQAIARALVTPLGDLFDEPDSKLSAEMVLQDLAIARLVKQLGRMEVMARLMNPNFRNTKGTPCRPS